MSDDPRDADFFWTFLADLEANVIDRHMFGSGAREVTEDRRPVQSELQNTIGGEWLMNNNNWTVKVKRMTSIDLAERN